MSLSVADAVQEYWSARRKYAMSRARSVKRTMRVVERLAAMERSLQLEEEVLRLWGEVELWVDEARRCTRELRKVLA